MASNASVLIVEPREVLRRGLASMVESIPHVDRCQTVSTLGEVGTTQDTVDGATGPGPTAGDDWFDVAIAPVDIYTRQGPASDELPARHSIALIASSSPQDLEAAVQTRADGYLLLDETTTETLRAAVDDVLSGHTLLPEALSAHLLERARRPSSIVTTGSTRLSPREAEVLELIVAGLSNKEIAQQLGISIHGAKRHVSSVLTKFNAPSRSYLISQTLHLGVARPRPSAPDGLQGDDHE